MTRRLALPRFVRALGALAFLGGLAFAVWPAALGGAANFVVVRGHSMEPTYHQGDLLYARNDQSFSVGDIAVYRIPKGKPGAGALVVHRIKLRLPDGTYLMQGDNKRVPDDVTPSAQDLVATPILDLGGWPTKGLILAPIVFTMIVGIAVTVALWPAKDALELDEDGKSEDSNEPADDSTDERVRQSGAHRRRLLVRGSGAGPVATLTSDEPVDGQLVGAQGLAATDQLRRERVRE